MRISRHARTGLLFVFAFLTVSQIRADRPEDSIAGQVRLFVPPVIAKGDKKMRIVVQYAQDLRDRVRNTGGGAGVTGARLSRIGASGALARAGYAA